MPNRVRQVASIPVRDGKVCLVTSRSGRRWVLPKGKIDAGHTAGQAALLEAWEEAGLIGVLGDEPLGSYTYEKWGRDHHVLVYRLTVTEAHDEWPEKSTREREWVSAAEAVDRLEEPTLKEIVRAAFGLKEGRPVPAIHISA